MSHYNRWTLYGIFAWCIKPSSAHNTTTMKFHISSHNRFNIHNISDLGIWFSGPGAFGGLHIAFNNAGVEGQFGLLTTEQTVERCDGLFDEGDYFIFPDNVCLHKQGASTRRRDLPGDLLALGNAEASAVALPMPEVPPVIRTVFFSKVVILALG
jgi:hypothetical protein